MSARRQPVPPPPPSPPRAIHVVVPRHLPARELSRSPLEIKLEITAKTCGQTESPLSEPPLAGGAGGGQLVVEPVARGAGRRQLAEVGGVGGAIRFIHGQ